MKFFFILIITTILLLQTQCQQSTSESSDSGNPYASDPKVKHSLYMDKNLWNRISGDEHGVPMKKITGELHGFDNPESYVAFKIAKYYRNLFEFLDEDANDYLIPKDLERAYKMYNWPMPTDVTVEEYVKTKFKMYDTKNNGEMDFVEFCHFMEDVWKFAEFDRQRNCISALRQAINVFSNLFEYLDISRSGFIDERNVKAGMSFVTNKNIDSDDVAKAFQDFDKDKSGKFDKQEFILACMNGGLTRSVENPSITGSFFG